MESMKEFFRNDRFADHVGIELIECAPGSARARLPIREHHLNAVGVVHGAAIFSLADLVFAVASNAHGNVALAVNASISFHKAAVGAGGCLTARASEVARNPKLASYLIEIHNEAEELIATFQGMVYRKKDPLPGV